MRFAFLFISGVAAFGRPPVPETGTCPNLCGSAGAVVANLNMVWGKTCLGEDGNPLGNTQVRKPGGLPGESNPGPVPPPDDGVV